MTAKSGVTGSGMTGRSPSVTVGPHYKWIALSNTTLGVLMATGLIVGESLFGVLFAGIVAASGSDSPLAVVGEGFENWALAIGIVLFVATVVGLYRTTQRSADDRT